jgi:hypothetical protein
MKHLWKGIARKMQNDQIDHDRLLLQDPSPMLHHPPRKSLTYG